MKRILNGKMIAVYIDSALAEQALEVAKAQDMSRSALIRKLLRNHLEQHKRVDTH